MSKMEEGRNGPGFTAAVIIALMLILGLFVWRVLPAPITSDDPAIARQAGSSAAAPLAAGAIVGGLRLPRWAR
jgi:hypothetical protein